MPIGVDSSAKETYFEKFRWVIRCPPTRLITRRGGGSFFQVHLSQVLAS